MRVPRLARAALHLAGGIVAAFRLAPDGVLDGPMAVALGGALLCGAVWSAARLLLVAAVGMAFGLGAAAAESRACGTRFVDGERYQLRVRLEELPAGSSAAAVLVRDACRGRLRVRWPDGSASDGLEAGASYRIRGRWWAFPDRPGWPRRGERAGVLRVEAVTRLDVPVHPLVGLRGSAQLRARHLFGERAGAVEALLLARRGGIDPEVRDRFARAGLMHLLAISGLHVGLVAGTLTLLGAVLRVPPGRTAVLAAAVTVMYVGFIGAPHAAARAALQVLLVLAARMLQRPALPFALLAAAAIPLLALDPFAVLDAGFQLSFAGTAGLIILRERLLRDWIPPGPVYLRESLAMSCAATLATAPIAALHFGLVAPVGVAANIAAVPLTAATVPALALALIAGALWEPAGSFIAGGATLLLVALESVAAAAADVPAGHAHVPPAALLGWIAAAAGFAAARRGLRRRRVRPRIRRTLLLAAAASAFAFWPVIAARLGDGALEIHAIDVGQGDALAIRTPRGRWLLVDAGMRSQRFDAGRSRVTPYLQKRGVRRLEWLILTHPDADHVGGAAAVLSAIGAAAVIDPAVAAGKRVFLDALDAASRAGAVWLEAEAGRELHLDGVMLTLLHPRAASLDARPPDNDLSVVFRLEYGRFAALFLGDATEAVEAGLVASHGRAVRADLVKIGHHGSITSSSEVLLRAAAPAVALISVGAGNRYGHPHPRVLERLQHHGVVVYRTDRHGWVRVRVRGDGAMHITTQRGG
jgi:competence protein ComEC